MRKPAVVVLVLLVAVAGCVWWLRRSVTPPHYTGFVEGEERVVRSEVVGRVLEVRFREGDSVPAGDVLVRLDDREIQTRLAAKRQEAVVADAQIATQAERIELTLGTWERDLAARRADVARTASAAELARRTLDREQELVATGASTRQLLDDQRAVHDQAESTLTRARAMLARTETQERTVALARYELATLRERRALLEAELAELEVTASKYAIHAPAVPTVVQTQLVWPGELAQAGTPVASVLDPADKYVQVYVPVPDLAHFRVGRRVAIELDSEPGRRVPGEVTFVADVANFTPEKIETRSDRLGQVYRAKVRILEDVERFQPGTEGNVYLDEAPG